MSGAQARPYELAFLNPEMEVLEMIIAAAASSEGYEAIDAWVRARVAPDQTYGILHARDCEESPPEDGLPEP
ncbi:hypothetical protein [Rhodovulum bhavnagarense]|uniref:hypothetical protein n=1 Tax=Rhodovulum bhavnagarense TaxID=992286 RepID=UPI00104B328B|nr:hypothetical protein [Rhodovulum bhavnagarense]